MRIANRIERRCPRESAGSVLTELIERRDYSG